MAIEGRSYGVENVSLLPERALSVLIQLTRTIDITADGLTVEGVRSGTCLELDVVHKSLSQ